MQFTALFNAICMHNDYLIVIHICKYILFSYFVSTYWHIAFYFQYYFASGKVLLICWISYVYVLIVLLWKEYVLSGEIALSGNQYYYYYCQYYYLHLRIQLNDHMNTNIFIFEINLFTKVLEDNHIFLFMC